MQCLQLGKQFEDCANINKKVAPIKYFFWRELFDFEALKELELKTNEFNVIKECTIL